ncbi:peptidoglycan-binding protein [Lutibacter sp. HS1-25]|uniref:L,D-transpeptidase family protein n=1 Tax=Lutibacter sp. HS1-25 TaxID=2485000 RepID=UPI0010135B78|nr:L,D-transpeptidase family protein [Lutibacter sp. HS1-25]RXP64592.1 peptidoglycan-binding protein [Lutibacter sp. HS1-25]
MKIFIRLLIILVFVACEKKQAPKVVVVPKPIITKEGRIIPIDSSKIASFKDSSMIAFYQAIKNKTFWLANTDRKKLISLLKNADDEGLFLKDFDIKHIQSSEENIQQLADSLLINYDILLTENLNRYIKRASKGYLNPDSLYTNWDLNPNNINFKKLLLNFQKKDSFNYAVKAVLPNHIVYKKLKEALQIINKLPKYDLNKIEIEQKLVLNDTNEVLIDIKKHLIFWKDLHSLDTITPIYNEETELAVKKFQMRHGLATDGVIGIGTVQALNFTKEERKKEIIINMERWRWFPRNFEAEYLIINIPDYTLHVVKNADTIKTNKVITGKAARKTPVLSSKLSYLVFNPTWTIPPTILKNDVIPAARRDISYFKNKNITVYNASNQIVNANNWSAEKAKSYRYVQSPGKSNALGLVKFMFPNRFSVYLHDTNSRGYFDKDIRALSSGCIRVQYPFELAEYLLDDAEKWNLDAINKVVDNYKTVNVSFKKDIYIHVLYWTAWSENGVLQFRDDLYNYDLELYKNLY